MKKLKKWQKILLIILCVVLSLLIVAASAFIILYKIGENDLAGGDDAIKFGDAASQNDNIVTYKGKKYKYNENMTSFLFLGIDKDEMGLNEQTVGTAGQADSIYLAAVDLSAKTIKLISISRDTYTDVGMYSESGKYVGTEKMQLCLSYAYGDGFHTSCKNTVNAVSRLLFNIPIKSYFSLEVSAIEELNDLFGGITVPEYDENDNPTGRNITLYGSEIERYLRRRDVTKLDSNNNRMVRQQKYVSAFLKKLASEMKTDLSAPVKIFNSAAPYSCTNITPGSVTYIATQLFTGGKYSVDVVKMPGHTEKGKDGYAVYMTDEDELTQFVLDTYYKLVK